MYYGIGAIVLGVISLAIGIILAFVPRKDQYDTDPKVVKARNLARKNGLLVMAAAILMVAVGIVLLVIS